MWSWILWWPRNGRLWVLPPSVRNLHRPWSWRVQQLPGRTAAAAWGVRACHQDPGGGQILEWYVPPKKRSQGSSYLLCFPPSINLVFLVIQERKAVQKNKSLEWESSWDRSWVSLMLVVGVGRKLRLAFSRQREPKGQFMISLPAWVSTWVKQARKQVKRVTEGNGPGIIFSEISESLLSQACPTSLLHVLFTVKENFTCRVGFSN